MYQEPEARYNAQKPAPGNLISPDKPQLLSFPQPLKIVSSSSIQNVHKSVRNISYLKYSIYPCYLYLEMV